MSVTAYSPVEDNYIQKFHNERILFILIGRKVFIEKEPSGLSHIEWIKTLDLSKVTAIYKGLNNLENNRTIIDLFTRGYYHNNKLVFYIGENFEVNYTVLGDIVYYIDDIQEKLDLSEEVEIGAGCIVEKGSIFKVKNSIGTIRDIKGMSLSTLISSVE